MTDPVSFDSSTNDATFVIGADLVEFDRRDLPIYAASQTPWLDACHDAAPAYGAPVDCVFGETGDVHLDGLPLANEAEVASIVGEDPLVSLGTPADSLAIDGAEAAPPELAPSFDSPANTASFLPSQAGGGGDTAGADGWFDYLA